MDSSVFVQGALDIHPVHIQRAPLPPARVPRGGARAGGENLRWRGSSMASADNLRVARTSARVECGDIGRTPAFAVYFEVGLSSSKRADRDSALRMTIEDIIDDAEVSLESAGFRVVRSMTLGFLAVRGAAVESGEVSSDWRGIVTIVRSSYARLVQLVQLGVHCTVFVHADSTLARPLRTGFTVADEDLSLLLAWMNSNAEEGIHYTTGSVRDLGRRARIDYSLP